MRNRGAAWVIVQAALLGLFLLVPRVGAPWPRPDMFRYVGWVLAVSGALLLTWSVLNLGSSFTPFPRPVSEGHLVTTGAYRYVRHPIYFALLIGCLGVSLATWSLLRLLLTLALLVFFDFKARREEAWLQEKYPEYASYKSRVKKLIPGIY